MKRDFSFKTRLLLSFWVVLLLALLLPPWYYYRILTREIVDEGRTSAVQQLELIHWMLGREKGLDRAEDLQNWLIEAGKQPGVRLSYIADGGKVIADSQVPFSELSSLESHAGRPEIIDARSQEVGISIRFSGTLQKELIYVAKRIHGERSVPPGTIRLAAPFSTIKDTLDRLESSFLVFLALVSTAAAILSHVLIRRLNKPVRELIATAEAIGAGDFKRRIHGGPGQEFYPLLRSINNMADSIEKHVQTITEQKQQLEAVFNAMQEGVMVLDAQGKIRSVNHTISRLLPDVSWAIGRRPLEVIVNAELQKLCDVVMSSMDGNVVVEPRRLQIAFGEDRIYDVSVVAITDRQREVGAVVVLHDISELKRLEKVRQDFVANVSHELRTPLTSIKGYAETLLSETPPEPETAASFLRVILKNANHMTKIVEDLLQLARLDARDNPCKLSSVNAAGALLTATKACAYHAEPRGVRVESDLPRDGIHVAADFDQLVQVFRNLLENAIRYSPPDGVVRVSWLDRGSTVTFSVRDDGPGIPAQHQQRIFERFYRIEKHRGSHGGSTGLGLAICRRIIHNHGGRIWVRSPNEEGEKGTTLYFTLRKARSESNEGGA